MLNNDEHNNLRYNMITAFIYVIGVILLIRLFNFQIVHGEEYRQLSNTRLTRETVITAARGEILDRTGTTLAGNVMGFRLELYKSKVDTNSLNTTILETLKILEKNSDSYIDTLPISINPIQFTLQNEERLKQWKKNNKIDENATAEEAFNVLKKKYEINTDSIEDARKIMGIRYRIINEGYGGTTSLIISKSISRASAIEIEERKSQLSGISIVTEPLRNYQYNNLASHVLGYIGRIDESELKNRTGYGMNDYIGKMGIEYVFEEYLKGKNGVKQVDMAIDGTTTAEYVTEEAVAGSNVVLTIDANLQRIAAEALAKNLEKMQQGGFGKRIDAKRGAVVVTNVKTGEILAMVSLPDFEPELFIDGIDSDTWNNYVENKSLYNNAIQGSYAPGSIFKMVTAIAGLETGAITINEKINDTGVYPHGHNPVCWIWSSYHYGHGPLSISDAIKHSCNYFFYEVGYRMGIEALEKYANYFGLGQKTGIELTGETSGTLAGKTLYDKSGKTWYLGNTLSAVIGQAENEFSPIQIAKYISMLTNGGKSIDMTLIKTIIRQDGTEVPQSEIREFSNKKLGIDNKKLDDLNINEDNLKAILEGMRSVTNESGGTAYSTFKNFNIEVGGKTGSAEAGDKTNGWFVGFAPFDDPEIAIVVLVENGGHGGYTAEVARDIIAQYFGMNAQKVVEDMTITSYNQSLR